MKPINTDRLKQIAEVVAQHLQHPELFRMHNPDNASGYLLLPAEMLPKVCLTLKQHPQLLFDYLSCISGIDEPQQGKMAVVYHIASLPNEEMLTLKVELEKSQPLTVPTISHLWQNADWLERETFDLLGIQFSGHPDLRRILLPADWEGYPLRKDYKTQQYYHGVKVDY